MNLVFTVIEPIDCCSFSTTMFSSTMYNERSILLYISNCGLTELQTLFLSYYTRSIIGSSQLETKETDSKTLTQYESSYLL